MPTMKITERGLTPKEVAARLLQKLLLEGAPTKELFERIQTACRRRRQGRYAVRQAVRPFPEGAGRHHAGRGRAGDRQGSRGGEERSADDRERYGPDYLGAVQSIAQIEVLITSTWARHSVSY